MKPIKKESLMARFAALLLVCFISFINMPMLFSQSSYCENFCLVFDYSYSSCITGLSIQPDSGNTWQIGKSHKGGFVNPNAEAVAIMTDTLNYYPANNSSAFIIKKPVDFGLYYGLQMFSGYYKVQTDSLNDYGTMEFSPDNGVSWVNMLNDTAHVQNYSWYTPKPVLTGTHANTFDVMLSDFGSSFNLNFGDTVQFKFSFHSDSIVDSLGGLLYDNICFQGFVEGISEARYKNIRSKIYPNPTSGMFAIEFENPESEKFHLAIYTIHSKLIYTQDNITDGRVVVDGQFFIPGTYVYKLTSTKSLKRSWGKFIMAR